MHTFCANACHGTNFLVNLSLANCYAYKHNSTIDESFFLGPEYVYVIFKISNISRIKQGRIYKEV